MIPSGISLSFEPALFLLGAGWPTSGIYSGYRLSSALEEINCSEFHD
jgi:hypothetical protein